MAAGERRGGADAEGDHLPPNLTPYIGHSEGRPACSSTSVKIQVAWKDQGDEGAIFKILQGKGGGGVANQSGCRNQSVYGGTVVPAAAGAS